VTLELLLFFSSLRKLFCLVYLLTGLFDAPLLLVLPPGRFYWHDRFTPLGIPLGIPRRSQILSTWPGNRADQYPLSKELSRRNCLHLPALPFHLVLLLHTAFDIFHGRQLGKLNISRNSSPHFAIPLFCCVLARTIFVPCLPVPALRDCVQCLRSCTSPNDDGHSPTSSEKHGAPGSKYQKLAKWDLAGFNWNDMRGTRFRGLLRFSYPLSHPVGVRFFFPVSLLPRDETGTGSGIWKS
jgi:hypothetical protein